jgi:hypothetical protein
VRWAIEGFGTLKGDDRIFPGMLQHEIEITRTFASFLAYVQMLKGA